MKKILALAFVLALVAIMAVPMAASAATSTVGGNVTASTVSVSSPSAIAFGLLTVTGTDNVGMKKAALLPGKVTVIPGTTGLKGWEVTAKSVTGSSLGFMTNVIGTPLLHEVLIGKTLVLNTWVAARTSSGGGTMHGTTFTHNEDLKWAGNGNSDGTDAAPNIDFCALQFVDEFDAAGVYSITITFTAILTGF